MPEFPDNVTCSVTLEKEQNFTYLDSVAWGAPRDDAGYDTDQTLAPRPRRAIDVCHCPPGSTCLDNSCILFACFEECTRCNNPNCQNKRLQQKQFIPTEIFDAGPKGRGLKIKQAVARGTLITEYTGVAVRAKHLNRLFRRYQWDRRLYILALDNDTYLDARHQGGAARFINHSCEPNCQMERWKVKGVLRAAVVALKDIPADTELTFDYQWERQRGRASTVCHCGTPSCRGTLEVQKSQTDQLMEEILQGHWLDWKVKPDQTLINRIIRVYSKQHDEYFIGEVTDYNGSTKHRILYRHTMNEVWEDLTTETWQVLDDPASLDPSNVMIAKKMRASEDNITTSHGSGSPLDEPARLVPAGEYIIQHYLLVQTNIKELLWSKHFIERCHRNCRGVQVTAHRVTNQQLQIDASHQDDYLKLLQQSTDGVVWKLFLQGGDVPKAHEFLTKAVAQLEFQNNQQQHNQQQQQQSSVNDAHSFILPRIVADALNQRLPSLQDKFRSISFQWAPSESKSKQFSRLVMDGAGEIEKAKEQLWFVVQELLKAYENVDNIKQQRSSLGWLAGTLTPEQLDLLYPDNRKTGFTQPTSFVESFERIYQCTIWVQDETDRGRVDSKNQLIISDADRRHVFFNCEPIHVDRLWKVLFGRVEELERGVEFWPIHLFFFQLINDTFFDWIYRNFETRLVHDPILRDHLRVEGPNKVLAKEVVQLQWACFQDSCRRESDWVFGRDWTTVSIPKSSPSKGLLGALDVSTASTGALEVAEIVNRLKLPSSVALHAVLILYRFVAVAKECMKARDAQLACIFLANKSQKIQKCLKLETIVEAGYATFYGSTVVVEPREKQGIAEKVLQAEQTILETLEYDVFWKGTHAISQLATSALTSEQIESVWKMCWSGQVLSAGPELWLKYGVEYVFAASAGLLQMDLSRLLPALYVVPLKVSQATKLLVESAKWGKPNSKFSPSHPVAELSTELLEQRAIIDNAVLSRPPRRPISTLRERRTIQGLPMKEVTELIVPTLKELIRQSSVTVYLSGSAVTQSTQVTLEGSWKANAIAEQIIRDTLQFQALEPSKPDTSFDPLRFRLPMKKNPHLLKSCSFRVTQNSSAKSFIPALCNDPQLKWLQSNKGFSQGALIEDSHSLVVAKLNNDDPLPAIRELISTVSEPTEYPSIYHTSKNAIPDDTALLVSMQQWPPDKVQQKETAQGFSAMALQELQLLTQLHSSSATGHPNIMLPVALCQPAPEKNTDSTHLSDESNLFSLFRSTDLNNQVADRQRRLESAPQIIYAPVLFSLSKKLDLPPTLLRCWCHDIVSAVKHCHDHDVIIRTWQPELIVALEDGSLALSSFYRATVQKETSDPYEAAKKAALKHKSNKNKEQVTAYTAPELLYGCPQYSKQTDVWACACLLAQLLLGKPLFIGKDRESLLQSHYKIVGAPSAENYKKAMKYPQYVKPIKPYRRGVTKALEHMLKHPHPLNEVLEQMLCLNPAERITMADVLKHPYFQTHNLTRIEFANDWLNFSKSHRGHEKNEERNKKRKAMIEAAVTTSVHGMDELYDLYDMDTAVVEKKMKE